MNVNKNITELVGNTPLLELTKLEQNAKIYAKLEYFNPAGSIKDRIALQMIEDAEKQGKINKDTVIIEPTSGNTGIGLALVCAAKGYKLILTMPDTMSIERRKFMNVYGADIVLSEGAKGMKGAISLAEELATKYDNSFIPAQFDNPSNPKAHIATANEIWNDTDGKVDIIVAGVGTGGTITGVGRVLKEKNSNIKLIAVEPSNSPYLTKQQAGPHKIQGIGAGFVPSILDTNIYDEVVTIEDEVAYEMVRKLPKEEGIFVGISSAAAVYAAIEVAKRPENKDKNIVVILADSGDRYLSNL